MQYKNEILKKRIQIQSEIFAHSVSKISVADVITFRRDAFQKGAIFALQNQWISVDEELPELMERVLVAYHLEDKISICIMKRIPHDSSNYNNGKWHWSLVNHKEDVIAWMPLPKLNN